MFSIYMCVCVCVCVYSVLYMSTMVRDSSTNIAVDVVCVVSRDIIAMSICLLFYYVIGRPVSWYIFQRIYRIVQMWYDCPYQSVKTHPSIKEFPQEPRCISEVIAAAAAKVTSLCSMDTKHSRQHPVCIYSHKLL